MVHFNKLAYEKYYNDNGEKFGHVNTRLGIRLHYNNYIMAKGQKKNAVRLKNLLNLDETCKCVIIGAGFNWTGEGLMEQGIETIGTDISDWILAEKDNTEEADLREYISKVGLDPDTDEIIGDPKDSRCKLYVPKYKQDGFDKWIVGPEAEKRREMIIWWGSKSEIEKSVLRINMKIHDFNPIMPIAPKPEYMINPLECFLNGGRSAPQPRTSVSVVGEGADTDKSRSSIRGLLNESPTHIITEQVLNSIDDDEGLILCENLAKMAETHGGDVYHILSAYREPEYEKGISVDSDLEVKISSIQAEGLNWKTYEDWRIFLDDNNFEDQKIIIGVSNDSYVQFKEVL